MSILFGETDSPERSKTDRRTTRHNLHISASQKDCLVSTPWRKRRSLPSLAALTMKLESPSISDKTNVYNGFASWLAGA